MRVLVLAAAFSAAFSASAFARDQIRIVGSSTVYPFTTAVAEQFGKTPGARTPIVESTGTGGGMRLFCAGLGLNHPDITNASRRMTRGEFENCRANGVTDILEINIGIDGITLAQAKSGSLRGLTLAQLYLAIAKEVPAQDGRLVANTNRNWSDIDRSLPDTKIEVLGPPPTSGTRDSLHELLMEKGAEQIPALLALKRSDPRAFDRAWKSLREDGGYIEAGENDNLIVQRLRGNSKAVGVFGYSFLEENIDSLRGIALDGVVPEYDNIASGHYRGARRMYVYIKLAHRIFLPTLPAFAAEYVSQRAAGTDGYLGRKGLVTLPRAELESQREKVRTLSPMTSPN